MEGSQRYRGGQIQKEASPVLIIFDHERNLDQYLADGNTIEELEDYCYRAGYGGLNGNHMILKMSAAKNGVKGHYAIWLLHLDDLRFRFYNTEAEVLGARVIHDL